MDNKKDEGFEIHGVKIFTRDPEKEKEIMTKVTTYINKIKKEKETK